jgi:hypothetical protein
LLKVLRQQTRGPGVLILLADRDPPYLTGGRRPAGLMIGSRGWLW